MKKNSIFKIFIFSILMTVSTTVFAQKDGFFRGGEEEIYQNRDDVVYEGLTNQPFGSEVPIGGGLLVLAAAGAGYVAMKRRHSTSKGTILLLACAMLLTMTQCKKRIETATNDGETVHITLKMANNGKHIIDPNESGYVPVIYKDGDEIYVGNDGHYIGKLTYNETDNNFSGDIITPSTSDYLHFYFIGGCTPSAEPVKGTTTDFTVDISDQLTKLPVLSYVHTAEHYYGSKSYTCVLENKCALVEFKLTKGVNDDNPVKISNMLTEAKIDFANPGITPTGKVDAITLYYSSSNTRWGMFLPYSSRNAIAIEYTGNQLVTRKYFDIPDNNGISCIPELHDNDYYYGDEHGAIVIDNEGDETAKKLFVVSANGNVVQFSSGNLQYRASTQTWRFAQNPWSIVGDAAVGNVNEIIGGVNTKCNNANIASDYEGWIDMFGWGTWGFGKLPYNTSMDNSDYTWSTDFQGTLDGHDDWRVLTISEWLKLNEYHNGGSGKMGNGNIDGFQGIIVLPINDAVESFIPYDSPNATHNNITAEDWNTKYKNHGAIFFPRSGGRQGSSIFTGNASAINSAGYYWTSTSVNEETAYLGTLGSGGLNNGNFNKRFGLSVRLVR